MLLKIARNWNAVRKPLAVQLWTARCRKLYPLWTTLPSGVLLWGRIWLFSAFLWCISAV